MNQTTIPEPIVCETRVQHLDGSDVHIDDPRHGDTCNLSTGEVHVARMIGGVVYDTAKVVLIVGVGEYFGSSCYGLSRLYRSYDGKFFQLRMAWIDDVGTFDMEAITWPSSILEAVKLHVGQSNAAQFLRTWYCSGLLPIDDEFARDWAESVLPVAECESVLAAMAGRNAPRPEPDCVTDD